MATDPRDMSPLTRSLWDAAWDRIETTYGPVEARQREIQQTRLANLVCESHEHEFGGDAA